MSSEYFIVIKGKPAGPYQLNELEALKIHPGTFVKTTGMDDFKEAHELEELRDLFGFKKTITAPQYFATMDTRLLAVVIDFFLITFVYVLLTVALVAVVDTRIIQLAISASGLVLIPAIKLIYAVVMECSARQGTFGKIWLHIKVCDEAGYPVSAGRSLLRNISKYLSFATAGIGYLSGFFNKRQQCLHDIIAGTLVIKDRLI